MLFYYLHLHQLKLPFLVHKLRRLPRKIRRELILLVALIYSFPSLWTILSNKVHYNDRRCLFYPTCECLSIKYYDETGDYSCGRARLE